MTKGQGPNYGIVAEKISAKAIAVGPQATATVHENVDVTSQLSKLSELLAAAGKESSAPEVQVASKLAATAKQSAAVGDKKGVVEATRSIVSMFKALGDTISTSQKIVDVARGVLDLM